MATKDRWAIWITVVGAALVIFILTVLVAWQPVVGPTYDGIDRFEKIDPLPSHPPGYGDNDVACPDGEECGPYPLGSDSPDPTPNAPESALPSP